jgi:hypothetical protein
LGKKYVADGSKTISLEELQLVFGVESIKDADDGNVIKEAPLPVRANFQQWALDIAILEINTKTDLKVKLVSIERSKQRRVVALDFCNQESAYPKRQRDGTKRGAPVPSMHLIGSHTVEFEELLMNLCSEDKSS